MSGKGVKLYSLMIADTGQLKTLAATAVLAQFERQIDADTLFRTQPEGQHILVLKAVLDRIGSNLTEPIIRCKVLVALQGEEDPLEVPFFDVRMRDWITLTVPTLTVQPIESWTRTVDPEDLIPDENTPGAR